MRPGNPACLAVCATLAVMSMLAPAAHAVSARQLLEVVDFGPASVSPDGALVAYRTEQAVVERNTYLSVWYVQPIDRVAPPIRLGEGGAPLRDGGGMSLREPAVWSPDGQWIFYRAEFEGRVAVWRAAVDGSRTEAVTQDAGNVRAFRLSHDGRSLAYSVGATREEVVDAERADYDGGVHINRTVGLGDAVHRSGYHEGRLATQRLLHNELERTPLLAHVPDRWLTIDLATGVQEPSAAPDAAAPNPRGVRGNVVHSAHEPDGTRTAWLVHEPDVADGAGLRTRIEVTSAQRSKPHMCTDRTCTDLQIATVMWRPGSSEVVFTASHSPGRAGATVFRWDVVTGQVRKVVRTTGEIGGGGRWSPGPCAASRDALVCVTAEVNRPPRLERIDISSGERLVLADPNLALAHEMQQIPMERLEWHDATGQIFSGWLFQAQTRAETPPPLFIVYYRCSGFLRGGVGDEWPLATLARAGISALCINAAARQDDAIVRYEEGRAAVESVVSLLAARGAIDPRRVGMGGLSFGAEVSMWTAMYSSVLAAASVSTPVMSPNLRLTYGLWGDIHKSRLRQFWQLDAVDVTPEGWHAISPAFAPERVGVPVLMQMSEQEYRTSLDYLVPLIRLGRADAYVFPHEPHQKFQPRHKLAVYERNLDWFRFWLQGFEDADVSKRDQYARWREMRASAP